MKKCSIYNIKGGEVLANPIMTSSYQVILSEGTVLRREYIENFIELGITDVYIYEDNIDKTKGEVKSAKKESQQRTNEEYEKTKIELIQIFKEEVKNILERHIYSNNKELEKLSNAASIIIDNILKEENIIEEMIEMRDRSGDLYEHSMKCCTLATILALRLNYKHAIVHEIGVGCLLHDIGLRYISMQYQNIDVNDMSESQKLEYKKHTIYGYSSLENEKWLDINSKNIILYHHERLDGTGYPFHKKNISEEIIIASICDTFDEMVCGIGYRAVKVYKAVEYLKSFKKVKFSDKIIDEFLKIVAVYPVGSYVLTNTGEIGVVVRQNKKFPERPVLRIMTDKNGCHVYKEIIVDLLKENSVFIEDVIN